MAVGATGRMLLGGTAAGVGLRVLLRLPGQLAVTASNECQPTTCK